MKKKTNEMLNIIVVCVLVCFSCFAAGHCRGWRDANKRMAKDRKQYRAQQRCIEGIKNWDGKSAIELDVEGLTITGSMFVDTDSNSVIVF